jgi:AcrR family transcriptional regulator
VFPFLSSDAENEFIAAEIHPTKESLVADVVELLDTHPPEQITISLVLERTGVSSGSLYHFFNDLSDLIEHAMLRRFMAGVQASIAAVRQIIAESTEAEEFLSRLDSVTTSTQDPERAPLRFERARMLGMAQHSERWHNLLRDAQQHLTDELTTCFVEAQAKGWLNREFSPRAGAVLIQAYTFGRIIDDITETPMDNEDWTGLISLIVRRALGPQPH